MMPAWHNMNLDKAPGREHAMTHLLLIDDDVELCNMLTEYLTAEGFDVDTAHEGNAALGRAVANDYDVIILDVMLPGMNGFDILRQLRQQRQTPVLMLTARGDDVDSIVGLELGADDYLPKPCNPRVLVARIRAVLRRHQPVDLDNAVGTEPLVVGNLKLFPASRQAQLNDRTLTLTSTEFTVLEVLVRKAGQIVSKEALSEQALGRSLERYDRSLDMHVSSLRRKLGDESMIKTIRSVGYQFALPPQARP